MWRIILTCKAILVTALITMAPIILTGCSQWYADAPEYTEARQRQSITPTPYDKIHGYELPDMSGLAASIEGKATSIEQKKDAVKEDFERSYANVAKSVGEVQEGIADSFKNSFED